MAKNDNYHFHRFEFKYHLSPTKAKQIREELLDYHFIVDPRAQNLPDNQYTVNSLYLDSPDYICYHDKIHGLKNRFKVRLRNYGPLDVPDDNIFVEIRRKQDALIIKDRFKNSFANWENNGKKMFSATGDNQTAATDINYHIRKFNLSPKVLVSYTRKPLESRFIKRLRVTFDSNLRGAVASDMRKPIFYPFSKGLVVMEIKYLGSLPAWFGKIIKNHNLAFKPFSKYCHATERLSKLNLIK